MGLHEFVRLFVDIRYYVNCMQCEINPRGFLGSVTISAVDTECVDSNAE